MSAYSHMELDALVKQLSDYTQELMKMITSGVLDGQEFTRCRENIITIQKEIQKRNPLYGGSEVSPFLNPGTQSTSPEVWT